MVERDRGQYTFDMFAALAERTIKRLWIIIILLVVLLFGSNAAWIWYESQWEVTETYQEVQQDANGDGTNNFVGGNYYGTPSYQNEDENANP